MKIVHLLSASVMLALTLGAPPVRAVVVDATVTQLSGSYLYEISIHNDETEELAFVSLVDGPLADPLIDSTLTTPVGFIGNYDSGLGFVDFLADTSSFLPGLTVDGFSFESLTGPEDGYFMSFEALDILGNPYSGSVNITVRGVPESGGTLMTSALVCAALAFIRRRRATH
ncbi:MAG: hypothetical protein ACKV19_17715 [Verrucomicrobiales bacterium]